MQPLVLDPTLCLLNCLCALLSAGFTCNFQDEFQCENGPCVSKDLVCDGDSDCLDNSDESDCTCSAAKFACPSGECISIENLCDSKSNCQDGTDESRCGKKHRSKTK